MPEQTINKCTVCDRPRAALRARKSKLFPTQTLFLCNECFEDKREHRSTVIVAARSFGISAVKEYIVNHRYYGDKIRVDELF
jgi:hypothetical protein